MEETTRHFDDLDRAIEGTQSLFEEWVNAPSAGDLDEETLHHAKLVLHEWLANLAQHAEFAGRAPDVRVNVRLRQEELQCAVTDNSSGFELEAALNEQNTDCEPFPERMMGLRIIDACTEELSYVHVTETQHRLEFSISSTHSPWLNNLF